MTITQERIAELRHAAETIIEKYGGPDYSIRMTAGECLALTYASQNAKEAARTLTAALELHLSTSGDKSLSKGARDALAELQQVLGGDDA